ncbi:hypothetical protein ACB092_06G108800 [Castanea dentata]
MTDINVTKQVGPNLTGPTQTKLKSTWTRIMRMDYGLRSIIRATDTPMLGKRGSPTDLHATLPDEEEKIQRINREKLDQSNDDGSARVKPNSGGGLALLWKKDIMVDLINFTDNHIHAKVKEEDGFVWWLTCFYGWPETFVEGPWLCIGDFNAFLQSSEKLSKWPAQECQLEDLGFKGYPYTWNNKRPGEANTRIWLERQKIKCCSDQLNAWGASKARMDNEEIKQLQKRLESLNMEETTDASKAAFSEAQRSRISWLKHGDKNTKIFHSKAKQRRRRNYIQGVKNSNGGWVEEVEDISEVAIDYFDNLFIAGTCSQVDDCLNTVEHKVTPDMQQILSSDFTTKEIKAAVFQIGPTKALGLDASDNVVIAVLDYLNSGVMGPDVNHTNIVLIPKIKSLDRMSEFRPISLLLANSAFVPGRLITDNVLVAYEVLHSMHSKKTGKKGSLALKLDINIMTKLGFPERWIQWVMGCVTTPTFSILINGKTYDNIRPSRGIRQRDPLSPYLFLLCAKGSLHYYRGQNWMKPSVYFSSNTQQGQKAEIVSMLGVKVVERFELYLGLPTLVGRAKIWKELQGWKGMMLSRAGKEVLIKAVIQAIPIYTMGVFLLPVKLCEELNVLYAKFSWGQVGNERKIHWKSWGSLTQSKDVGGMGFWDLRLFNYVMLAKQGWRLTHDQNSLFFKCFKARYFPRCHLLDATVSPNCSFVWRSIMAVMPILRSGSCWRVGSGESIKVLMDKWIPNYPSNRVLHPVHEGEGDWRVSDLIDLELHEWEDAEAICKIPLSYRRVFDVMVSLHNRKGIYSVKSGYHVARKVLREGAECSTGAGQQAGKQLWKVRVPNKMKVFAWRACHEILPTRVNLAKRNIIIDNTCRCCQQAPETAIHAI